MKQEGKFCLSRNPCESAINLVWIPRPSFWSLDLDYEGSLCGTHIIIKAENTSN